MSDETPGDHPYGFITTLEAEVISGLGRGTVIRAIQSGELQSVKPGRERLIDYESFLSWLAARKDNTPGED